jgi:Phosphatidylethanolamine-binding protein
MSLRAAVLGLCLAGFAGGSALAGDFAVTSPSVSEGATIGEKHLFAGFGCTGGNKSPALAWTDAPADAKSFAVTVYDPDAPTGSGWWHWVVFNIPAGTTELKEGAGQGRRMKSSSQKREHVIIVPGGLLAPRPHTDPGCSVPAHEVNGDLAQNGQVASCRAIPDAAVILAEGDIQHPMEPIFYGPMSADRLNQHCRIITAA